MESPVRPRIEHSRSHGCHRRRSSALHDRVSASARCWSGRQSSRVKPRPRAWTASMAAGVTGCAVTSAPIFSMPTPTGSQGQSDQDQIGSTTGVPPCPPLASKGA